MQQNSTQNEHKDNSKKIATILAAIALAAIISTIGTYFLMNKELQNQKTQQEKQVQELRSRIQELQ